MAYRILFVTCEVQPYVKVGGLADVSASLPAALARLGHDVRVLVPATAGALAYAGKLPAATVHPSPAPREARLIDAPLADTGARVWLLDTPGFRLRDGTPYEDANGKPYRDDAARYNELAEIAALIAGNAAGLQWQPDIVHCNEWQTGLVPVHMMLKRIPAAAVFTIHNLYYQGLFPLPTLNKLGLPGWLGHPDALEFHRQLNFMKGGLAFADKLSTVSPRYAAEIQTPAFGDGLDGVLRQRAADLTGILNGIDRDAWDPATDAALASRFDARHLADRRPNREALYGAFGLPRRSDLLVGMVTRLTWQKGVDILLNALPALMRLPVRFVILGKGEAPLQAALLEMARRYPRRLAVRLDHDETLARRIYAGCDAFLMPSRFEPCGLSQLYAMRYGALPIVHRTGGLADTVIDAAQETNGPTGFVFDTPTPAALTEAVARAAAVYPNKALWRQMSTAGMQRNFSWYESATAYAALYKDAIKKYRI